MSKPSRKKNGCPWKYKENWENGKFKEQDEKYHRESNMETARKLDICIWRVIQLLKNRNRELDERFHI